MISLGNRSRISKGLSLCGSFLISLSLQRLHVQNIDHLLDVQLAHPPAHVVNGVPEWRQLAINLLTDVGGEAIQ